MSIPTKRSKPLFYKKNASPALIFAEEAFKKFYLSPEIFFGEEIWGRFLNLISLMVPGQCESHRLLYGEDKNMLIFQYGQTEIEYLKRKDKKLGAAIDRIGMIRREITPDPFIALVSSIVSQQISNKAARTVWNRLAELLGSITPGSIAQVDLSELQGCGMSQRKAGYIKGIADAAISGRVDFYSLNTLTDDEIIKKLSSLRGIGVWTAEMLLIFSLCRPDVVSYKDLAICRGMMNLYGLKELSKEKFERYKRRYSPYGSVASLYLWELSVI